MNEDYTEEKLPVIADTILCMLDSRPDGATVLALEGDLGAGKTTLTKTIATLLGVQETVVSPTFVIAKFYTPTKGLFTHFVHIDAYRIESIDELKPLGFERLLQQPNTLIIVEWPERIKDTLPANTEWFSIRHAEEGRHISQKQ
jgi:tRNA threonylcarbamoyladenosine biosynthesis protein TsaE